MVNNFEEVLLQNFVQRRVTFLGAGPMSTISVDSVIELANEFKEPIALIPSRRQIESASLGGGYVNSWTTEDFVKYVRNRDKGSFVKLSRDHSGPWQFKELNDEGKATGALREASEGASRRRWWRWPEALRPEQRRRPHESRHGETLQSRR